MKFTRKYKQLAIRRSVKDLVQKVPIEASFKYLLLHQDKKSQNQVQKEKEDLMTYSTRSAFLENALRFVSNN